MLKIKNIYIVVVNECCYFIQGVLKCVIGKLFRFFLVRTEYTEKGFLVFKRNYRRKIEYR